MIYSAQFIKDLDKLEPDLKAVLLSLLNEIERNREESITRKEFWEFSQKTDKHFQRVWTAIGELTDAQKRTEKQVEGFAAAQQRTEQRLEELAAAQQRTEKRVEELAAAQQRTEQRLEELAAAQQRTEEALTKLIHRVDNIEVQLGGTSNTIGYGLKDHSYPALKRILKDDLGFEICKLYRTNLVYKELNLQYFWSHDLIEQ